MIARDLGGAGGKAAARLLLLQSPRPRPPGPIPRVCEWGRRASDAPARVRTRLLAVSRARPRPPLPPPFPPLPPSALSLGGSGGGGSRSLLARYIKGRSRRTGRLELQPVAAAAALGAVAGVGSPSAAPSGERATPPNSPRGRGLIFFFSP